MKHAKAVLLVLALAVLVVSGLAAVRGSGMASFGGPVPVCTTENPCPHK